jgi:hypothetical protein
MRNLFTNNSSLVNAGAARSGIAWRQQTLQIVNGSAWVTIEGELHDYWLSAGDALDIRPGRLVVVEASNQDVSLKVAAASSSSSSARRTLGGLAQQARRWLQLRLKQPVRDCVSTVDKIGEKICGSQLSSSGWRRLGHL